MPAATYRNRQDSAEVQALIFTGANDDEVRTLVGQDRFDRDHLDGRDSEVVAHVYYALYSTWQGVKIGEWIVLIAPDEATRLDPEVFASRYEPASA